MRLRRIPTLYSTGCEPRDTPRHFSTYLVRLCNALHNGAAITPDKMRKCSWFEKWQDHHDHQQPYDQHTPATSPIKRRSLPKTRVLTRRRGTNDSANTYEWSWWGVSKVVWVGSTSLKYDIAWLQVPLTKKRRRYVKYRTKIIFAVITPCFEKHNNCAASANEVNAKIDLPTEHTWDHHTINFPVY